MRNVLLLWVCLIEKIWPRTLFLLLLFIFTGHLVQAQQIKAGDLFIPKEIQKAYQAGTRALDGKPGPNYWQNHAAYNIKVEIIPEDKQLKGKATIAYTNHSPSPLKEVYFTLLYDITRKGNIRDTEIPDILMGEGTLIRTLSINDQVIDLKDEQQVARFGTHLRVQLSEPLPAGDTLSAYIEWEEALLPDLGRIGYVDSTTCFVGYWYPKISVYDDIDGWDVHSFLGTTEFYNDLSDLSVAITIPENYSVWATGLLQNAGQLLPDAVKARFDEAAVADEVVTIIGEKDREQGLRMKSNTWHFKAEKVPDFAFAFSDHYLWEGTNLKTSTGRVSIYSIYPASRSEQCQEVTGWQRDILQFFSEDIPGIPFPYPQFTSFFKPYFSGGMEFPMLANNGSPGDKQLMIGLLAHEMFHMYIPFYVRINESKYAWMDEGWADFMDFRALSSFIGSDRSASSKVNHKLFLEKMFGTAVDIPLLTSSTAAYSWRAYTQPMFIYNLLEDALGKDVFKQCLQTYLQRWAYKAPTPYDFFFSFNDVSGEDLSWFWQPWFMEYGYPDLGIGKIEAGKVTVVKKGNKPMPVELTAIFENGDTVKTRKSIAAWKDGATSVTIDLEDARVPTMVLLNEWLPDVAQADNFYMADEIIPEATLATYAGVYSLNHSSSATITAGQQHLILESNASGNKYLFLPLAKNKFGTPDGTFTIAFTLDQQGKVQKYEGRRLGKTFSLERLK